MNKHLKKLRDDLAFNDQAPPFDNTYSNGAFKRGFDAATKELMRVIEIQREALKNLSFPSPYHDGSLATQALKEADAIMNGEKRV